MKLFIKVMILLVVLACAAPFILKRSDGLPWMSVSDLKAPDISMPDVKPLADKISSLSDGKAGKESPEPTMVYKWKDKNGVWHFADKESTTSPGEAIKIDAHANLVHIERRRSDGNPYQQLPGLIDQAGNVEQALNQHSLKQAQSIEETAN